MRSVPVWIIVLSLGAGPVASWAQTPDDVIGTPDTVFTTAYVRVPISYVTSYDRDVSTGTWSQNLSYGITKPRFALATNASTGEVRATHRRVKRKYKTRMRMPSKLDPHLATIKDWLAAEPQITALAILRRLTAIDPDTFGDKQHSIVQRLLKALRRKAAQRVIAETTAEGGQAKMPKAGVGGPAVGLRPPSGPTTPAPLQPHHQRFAPGYLR